MLKEDVILFYQGKVTREFLDSLYQMAEPGVNGGNRTSGPNKKLFNILVESLQNIYQHGTPVLTGATVEPGFDPANTVFIILGNKDGGYRVVTGNHVSNEDIPGLRADIEKINSLERSDLRAYYLEKLRAAESSEKGGAGLGLIDIARKSGNKLDYRFDSMTNGYSFFSLIVKIDG